MMNMNDVWNRVGLRIGFPAVASVLPAELLALGTVAKNGRVFSIDIGPGLEVPLEPRMELLREFLVAHKSLLQTLPQGCDSDIFVGWSPRAGQDSLTIRRSLLRLLAELNLELVFDMYTEEDDDEDTLTVDPSATKS